MGSLEQKQTEEWTLLKGWSFVSKMFYREEPALSWAVVAHTFNPSTWEAEAGGSL